MAEGLEANEIDAVRRGALFAAKWDGVQDKFGREQVKYRGITLSLYPDKGVLIMEGALPTFANGNNLHLLTYPEMVSACAELAAAVGLPSSRLPLVRLELSNDLDSTTPPRPFLQSLQHHKGSKFTARKPPKGVARPLEYFASHAEYEAKVYDKGTWEKRHGNLLPAGQYRTRFEVVMMRARPINALWNRSETTLADLTSLEFYAAAAALLEQRWKEVVRAQPLDFTGLKGKDRLLLGAGANPEFWRGLKADRAPITIKRTKKHYNQLVEGSAKRVGPDEYAQRFRPALNALLPPVATAQNDTFFHTSSLLDLPLMQIERGADASPNEREQERLRDLERERRQEEELDRRREQWQKQEQEKEREEQASEREWYEGPADAARCCQTCCAPIASHRKPETRYCGKKCRNGASNPRNNAVATRRKIMSQGPLLFDDRAFVRVPEQYRAFVLAAA